MAVFFYTDRPKGLLADFKSKIDAGHVVTWAYDADGDFTHTAPQWKGEAWLRPVPEGDKLALYILTRRGKVLSKTVYGIYHGRFIESVATHCDDRFTTGAATAMPVSGKDHVN